MEWFYSNEGNRLGPVTPLVFEGLVRDGIVRPETLVWAEGLADWKAFSQLMPETAVCAASGGRHLQRTMVPYEGKFISAEHKEQFFQRLREGVQAPGTLVYAGFWIRFVAKFIDGLINWVINTVVNLVLSVAFFGSMMFQPKPEAGNTSLFLAYTGVTMLCNLTLGLLYYWFFLKKYSATPGKLALGLKVVRSDGSPLSTGRIIGRHFAEMLNIFTFMIGYIMAAFDDEKRALHDRICDTRVIKAK